MQVTQEVFKVIDEVFESSDLNPCNFLTINKECCYNLLQLLQEIHDYLEDIRGFIQDNDIICYDNAIDYLSGHDSSLMISINLAKEYGIPIEKLNSEVLSSILWQYNLSDEFETLWQDVLEKLEV